MNRPAVYTSTNHLLRHEAGNPVYNYDAHGNMTTMPHLTAITWNYADLLRSASNGTFTSCYVYNAGGGRTRKVVVKGNIREERLYLGNYELYRKYVNNTLDTERQTLHIADDQHRFALIDRLTVNNGATLTTPTVAVRYQYDNHLGSASLELDQNAAIISYEEYHPFGTTSYRSGRTETEIALKRYKYVGKERDEETGLYYYGARYYAAWIAKFVSVDPLQLKYPHYTPYQYAGNKPVSYIDLDGLEEVKRNKDENTIELKEGRYYDKDFNLIKEVGNGSSNIMVIPEDKEVKKLKKGKIELKDISRYIILPDFDTRQKMYSAEKNSNSPTKDDRKGGFHEEGGVSGYNNNGQIETIEAASSSFFDLEKATENSRITFNPFKARNKDQQKSIDKLDIQLVFHIHPRGRIEVTTKTYNDILQRNIYSTKPRFFKQEPSFETDPLKQYKEVSDIQAMKDWKKEGIVNEKAYGIVIGAYSGKAYFYDENGVFLAIDKKLFYGIK